MTVNYETILVLLLYTSGLPCMQHQVLIAEHKNYKRHFPRNKTNLYVQAWTNFDGTIILSAEA